MTLDGESQVSGAATLLALWASSDPKVAAEWAAQFPAGETRSQAIPEIAETWAATEPEKAVAWTLGLPDSPEQRQALDDALRTWTVVAPQSISSWVDQQPPGEATDHLRAVTAGTLVESQPQDALAMVTQITDRAARENALAKLLNRWGKGDPAAARSWVAGASLPPAVSERLKIPQGGQP
jgi:hypothetical protein